jgi:tellurite resistance protein TerC
MEHSLLQWCGFIGLIFLLLALDLGLGKNKSKDPTVREALIKTLFFVSVAAVFNLVIYYFFGAQKGMEFTTGYLIEEMLSVDNLFVFIMIFSYFGVLAKHQHRILFWGILGALILRGVFIGVGTALVARFHWIFYIFGGVLIYSGAKLFFSKGDDDEFDAEKNLVLRLAGKILPVKSDDKSDRFFVRFDGRWFVTRFFLVLLVVETSDLLFAMDSIPAVFAISKDPFVIFTSNVFAILGLRSLYFLLASVMGQFAYLKHGVCLILIFVGVKMVGDDYFQVSTLTSLLVIVITLASSMGASMLFKKSGD